jgi:hypothetical protein
MFGREDTPAMTTEKATAQDLRDIAAQAASR